MNDFNIIVDHRNILCMNRFGVLHAMVKTKADLIHQLQMQKSTMIMFFHFWDIVDLTLSRDWWEISMTVSREDWESFVSDHSIESQRLDWKKVGF